MDDPQRLKDLLGQTAKLNFRMVDTSISVGEASRTRIPSRSEIIPDDEGFEYLVMKKVLVSGERLVDAQASFDATTNSPVVNFRFDTVGGKYFAKATSGNVGKPFAIISIELFSSKVGCSKVSRELGSILNTASFFEINFSFTMSTAIFTADFEVLLPERVCNIQSFLFSTVNSTSCISL